MSIRLLSAPLSQKCRRGRWQPNFQKQGQLPKQRESLRSPSASKRVLQKMRKTRLLEENTRVGENKICFPEMRSKGAEGSVHQNGPKTNMRTRPRLGSSDARSNRWPSSVAGPALKGSHNAQRNYQRYLTLAQAEARTGNVIAAENYYQHAEHYFRSMSSDAGVAANGRVVLRGPQRSARRIIS